MASGVEIGQNITLVCDGNSVCATRPGSDAQLLLGKAMQLERGVCSPFKVGVPLVLVS